MCASSGGPTGHESSAGQKAKRLPGPIFTANLKQIANHAATSHLPSIYNVRDFAEAGGLVTYGPDRVDLFRMADEVHVSRMRRRTAGFCAARRRLRSPRGHIRAVSFVQPNQDISHREQNRRWPYS